MTRPPRLRLPQLTLRSTLIATLGLLALLLSALGGLGLYSLQASNSALRAMVSQRMQPLEQLMRVSQALDQSRLGLASAIISPLELERDMQALEQTLAQGRRDWQAFAQRPLSAPEQTLVARFDAQQAELQAQGVAPTMEALRAFNVPGASELYSQNLQPRFAPARQTLDQLVRQQRELAEADYARSQRHYQLVQAVSLAALGAGLGLSLLAGWRLVRAISRPLRHAVGIAQRVARGDLSQQIQAHGRQETAQLLAALGQMSQGLQTIVREVRLGTEQIASGSQQIAGGSADLSSRTEQQASALQQTNATMLSLTETVDRNSRHAGDAEALAGATAQVAAQCGALMQQVVASMARMQQAAGRITEMVGLIDSIAFQTNILALNAAVEAARAGEQGRGFAVVAGEVRELAQRSATAARQIKNLVGETETQVCSSTALVDQAGGTLARVVRQAGEVSTLVAAIAGASREQALAIAQAGQAIQAMDQGTQQNAALVEQTSAAAEALRQQADALARLVQRFQLD